MHSKTIDLNSNKKIKVANMKMIEKQGKFENYFSLFLTINDSILFYVYILYRYIIDHGHYPTKCIFMLLFFFFFSQCGHFMESMFVMFYLVFFFCILYVCNLVTCHILMYSLHILYMQYVHNFMIT